MFPASTYIERRQRLRRQVRSGLLVFLGNDPAPANFVDNPYLFRQDSSFIYFFGLDQPRLAAVIDIEEGSEILFGNDVTEETIVWTGPLPSLTQQAEQVGIHSILPLDRLADTVRKAVEQDRPVHFLPPYRGDQTLWLSRLTGLIPDQIADRSSSELITAVAEQRSTKTAEEVRQIENAIDTTHEMFRSAFRMAWPGTMERQIVAECESICRSRGVQTAFLPIVTVQGQVLHNTSCHNTLRDGHLLVCDLGAESELHYAGDITRTAPVSGVFLPQQREIYSIVLSAQLSAVASMKPGVEFREVHRIACVELVRGLKEIGLMKGDPQQAVAENAHTLFFPCGLGHMLGLDVHDMEALGEDFVGYTETIRRRTDFGWRSLRLAKAIQPGYVITVEPGIYFIPELIDRWQADNRCSAFINFNAVNSWRDFGGIRIEDVILVTQSSCMFLGKEFPRKIEDIEAMTQD